MQYTRRMQPGEVPESGKKTQPAEVCAHLKKALDGLRLYEPGHATLKGFLDTLYQKLTAALADQEELPLGLTASTITFQGKPVFSGEKREDAITNPLFLDGIRRITFCPGLTEDELSRLLRIWRQALDGELSGAHTFSTRFWEGNFQFVRTLALETFVEGTGGEEGAGASQEDALKAVMSELSSERLAGGSTAAAGVAKLTQVTKEDLQLLKMDALADLSSEDLATQDLAKRSPVSGLADADAAGLREELLNARQLVVSRAIRAVTFASLAAQPDELSSLVELLRSIFAALLKAKRFGEVADSLAKLVADARSDLATMEDKFRVLPSLLSALEGEALLGPTIQALSVPATAEHAGRILKFVRPQSVGLLLDALPAIREPTARQRLSDIVVALAPSGAAMAERLSALSGEDARLFLSIADRLRPEEAIRVRQAAAFHSDPEVRLEALRALKKEGVLADPARYHALVADPDPRIRKATLSLFVSARDRRVVPSLEKLVDRTDLDPAERKSAIQALGTLGGSAAAVILRKEFARQEGLDLRLACIQALGLAADESFRPFLAGEAKKFFGNRTLKRACQEALSALDARHPTKRGTP